MTDKQLTEFTSKIFEAVGTPTEEAAWVADCLVKSNLKGVDSHGIRLIPYYMKAIKNGTLKPGAKIKTVKQTQAITLLDGGGGFGYTMAKEAMEIAIEKAKHVGASFSGVRNLHHIGRVGRWPEMALDHDMIGIASQPGDVYVAPWGGLDRKLPIAPIAFAIPAGKYPPVIIDMSLGPVAGGRAAILALRKKKVPMGWLIDDEGKPTDDPAVFNRGEGAQLPLGQAGLGYKGMALAMILDILCGPLIGAFENRGVFFGAIDIGTFTPVNAFKKSMDKTIAEIKSSRLAPGFSEILVPGEPEWREQERRLKEGIFIDDEIWKTVIETAKQVGVNSPPCTNKHNMQVVTHPSYTLKDRY